MPTTFTSPSIKIASTSFFRKHLKISQIILNHLKDIKTQTHQNFTILIRKDTPYIPHGNQNFIETKVQRTSAPGENITLHLYRHYAFAHASPRYGIQRAVSNASRTKYRALEPAIALAQCFFSQTIRKLRRPKCNPCRRCGSRISSSRLSLKNPRAQDHILSVSINLVLQI